MSSKASETSDNGEGNNPDPKKPLGVASESADPELPAPVANSDQHSKSTCESKAETPDTTSVDASVKLSKPPVADPGPVTPKVDPELEAYQKLRQSLKNLVKKKAKIDKELEELEDNIGVREDTYLQESSAGNVAKGFDQYTKSSQNRRKSVVTDQDRIFSQSSTSFEAEL